MGEAGLEIPPKWGVDLQLNLSFHKVQAKGLMKAWLLSTQEDHHFYHSALTQLLGLLGKSGVCEESMPSGWAR